MCSLSNTAVGAGKQRLKQKNLRGSCAQEVHGLDHWEGAVQTDKFSGLGMVQARSVSRSVGTVMS